MSSTGLVDSLLKHTYWLPDLVGGFQDSNHQTIVETRPPGRELDILAQSLITVLQHKQNLHLSLTTEGLKHFDTNSDKNGHIFAHSAR